METLRGFENPNDNEAKNREQRADVLLRFLNIAENIESLHGQKFETVFSDEEHKREFIDNLSVQEFSELLNGVNGILRNKEKENWEMDGESVVLRGILNPDTYKPPLKEDKPELLAKVLSSAQEMNRDKRELKDIALLISSSLNAIHPYLDANGRTSRLIYLILTKDYNDQVKEEINEAMLKYGRAKIDINPGFIGVEIDSLIENEIGIRNPEKNPDNITNLFWEGGIQDIEFSQEINEKDKKIFSELLDQDRRYLFCSIFKYLQNLEDREKYLKKFPNRSALLIDVLSKDLNQEQLSQILQNYRDLKKGYVEKLIGSIANPENEEYQIEHDGENISLKNYFELRIKDQAEKIAEEDRLAKERQEAKER